MSAVDAVLLPIPTMKTRTIVAFATCLLLTPSLFAQESPASGRERPEQADQPDGEWKPVPERIERPTRPERSERPRPPQAGAERPARQEPPHPEENRRPLPPTPSGPKLIPGPNPELALRLEQQRATEMRQRMERLEKAFRDRVDQMERMLRQRDERMANATREFNERIARAARDFDSRIKELEKKAGAKSDAEPDDSMETKFRELKRWEMKLEQREDELDERARRLEQLEKELRARETRSRGKRADREKRDEKDHDAEPKKAEG